MKHIEQRDEKIDILRAFAILCILLAHSSPPGFIFQLRNFDVTLMVLLMGASYYLSNKNKTIRYSTYLVKRFRRLILPTWKFLVFFFFLFYLVALISGNEFYFSKDEIVTSFILTDGIGFVWIMRVFFTIAVVSPLLMFINEKVTSNGIYFAFIALLLVIYNIMLTIFDQNGTRAGIQTLNYIFDGVGYSLIAAIGIRLYKIKKTQLLNIALIFLLIFIVLMLFHHFSSTQNFKYPPTIYYFSYGLSISFLLIYFLSYDNIKEKFNIKPILFLSRKSLDLYYCHIIPYYIIELFGVSLPLISSNFVTRFLFLLIIGLLLVYLQSKFLSIIEKLKKWEFGAES